jgi:hypothetical protein
LLRNVAPDEAADGRAIDQLRAMRGIRTTAGRALR